MGEVMTTRERIEHRARMPEQAPPVQGAPADVVDLALRREHRRSPAEAGPAQVAEAPATRAGQPAPSVTARGPPAEAGSSNQMSVPAATTTGWAPALDATLAARGSAGRQATPMVDAVVPTQLAAPLDVGPEVSPIEAASTSVAPHEVDPLPVAAVAPSIEVPSTPGPGRASFADARRPAALRTVPQSVSDAAAKRDAPVSAVAVTPERVRTAGPPMTTRERIEDRARAPERVERAQRALTPNVVDLALLRERRQSPDATTAAPGTRATEHPVAVGAGGPPADTARDSPLGVPSPKTTTVPASAADAKPAAVGLKAARMDGVRAPAADAAPMAPGAAGLVATRTDVIRARAADAAPGAARLDATRTDVTRARSADAAPTSPGAHLDAARLEEILAPAVHASTAAAHAASRTAGPQASQAEAVSASPVAEEAAAATDRRAGIAPAAGLTGSAAQIDVPVEEAVATPKTIRYGSHGVDVEHAQDRLNAHDAKPPLAVDGIFGSLTRTATTSYQRSHGLDADGIIGPRTWASLKGPTVVGSGQVRGGATAPPARVLRYDTGAHRISPPPAGADVAYFLPEIKAKQDLKPVPDLGPTVNVTGVTQGSEEEIFLYNILVEMGRQSQWGREADLQTEIGRPSKANNNRAPIGQVTLRIDNAGNATVELVGRGAVGTPAAFATREAASKALMDSFGFASVTDESATWTVPELNTVHAALLRLPTADRVALNGLDLIRKSTIFKDGEQLDGLFASDSDTGKASLSIADMAFEGDALGFIGAGGTGGASASSMQTIAHEAAHAVETKALRDEQFKTMSEQRRLEGFIKERDGAVAAFNTAEDAAFAKARAYSKVQQHQARTYIDKHNAATAAINLLVKNSIDTDDVVNRLDTAAFTATIEEESELRVLARAQPKHPAPGDFKDASRLQREWHLSARSSAEMRVRLAKQRARERAVTGASGGSRRLALFVAFVNAKNIPRLTDYAARMWAAGSPREFFAEAYSLWLNDRQYLQSNAPLLVKWFDDGNYLK
jgi:peptidoglycan hydrolase-like protein with peptidoglycan-binding domain